MSGRSAGIAVTLICLMIVVSMAGIGSAMRVIVASAVVASSAIVIAASSVSINIVVKVDRGIGIGFVLVVAGIVFGVLIVGASVIRRAGVIARVVAGAGCHRQSNDSQDGK